MPSFATPPVLPQVIGFDTATGAVTPVGRVIACRVTDLVGLCADETARRYMAEAGDPVVYEVVSSRVPEISGELPQSVTTIHPGTIGGEFHFTRGHMHTRARGEVYLGLTGTGGLLTFDGRRAVWVAMAPGTIGYIPPGWAHRSVNTGDEPYRFLAVYPGDAGHDHAWVAENGMGHRVMRGASGEPELAPFPRPAAGSR
ncbi:glucose-6-phosphate isomerase family protein [Streptomyces iranensis]|uniref:glucose-6-phosphate isomerase family protein n=1 Tax=Streptomyces iranensis TaxID=576784 RepID=UPI0039B73E01